MLDVTSYDIIGDVHGCADKLMGLLELLGYSVKDGAYRHSERQAIFVGDLIDRGPQQVETIEVVRAMIDAGTAQIVMGNHEFNAISFATPNPEIPGEFVRRHSDRNYRQTEEFLEQVQLKPGMYLDAIEWFKTFPLSLDLGSIRIVHACWYDQAIEAVKQWIDPGAPMSTEFVVAANQKGTPQHEAIEVLLKGPELDLKRYGQAGFFDKDGHLRRGARIRWWDSSAATLRQLAEIPGDANSEHGKPYPKLPKTECTEEMAYEYHGDLPVFFGHYWRTGKPNLAGEKTVCVDYSAVKGGPLVAYQWDEGDDLKNSAFQFVGVGS
jgi:hypothetical protein